MIANIRMCIAVVVVVGLYGIFSCRHLLARSVFIAVSMLFNVSLRVSADCMVWDRFVCLLVHWRVRFAHSRAHMCLWW